MQGRVKELGKDDGKGRSANRQVKEMQKDVGAGRSRNAERRQECLIQLDDKDGMNEKNSNGKE